MPDPAAVAQAAAILCDGGLVAFPTETVYGLGADALDPKAVARIFAVKQRPADNPLIVHLADAGRLDALAVTTPCARRLAARWWPGPLTVVLRARPHVPSVTTAGLDSVAVRVPAHPVAHALLRAANLPVAAPSANRSGRPSPTTAQHVLADLGDAVDLILDGGRCLHGVESTVVDARGDRPIVLREGALSREQLDAVPGRAGGSASPGTRHRHYAPACRVLPVPIGEACERAETLRRSGAQVGLVAAVGGGTPPGVLDLGRFADAAGLAALLYDAFRRGEAAGCEVIVVESVAEEGIGRAVMDRLRRAAIR
ncbi:MAG: L-threonylcarbamoyladenylate synthase [Egibacteraceae bacterium]